MGFKMKVIVFGGSGFIGSHMADYLTKMQHQVTIFDHQESQFLKPGQTMMVGSILDLAAVKEAVKGQAYVMNFAGIAGLNDAKENPVAAAEVNIIGNLNVLEAIRIYPPKRYIFSSTYYIYSHSGSIYRVTKQSSELFIEEYAEQYDIPFTILRYGSVYGPRAGNANAIYRFLREAVERQSITRKGEGKDQREYIHVLDCAAAAYQIMFDDRYINRHLILTGQQRIKIDDLFLMINEMMGGRLSITYAPGDLNTHGHYAISPYSYKPQTALRFNLDCYHDLGQGMLSLMSEIQESLNTKKK